MDLAVIERSGILWVSILLTGLGLITHTATREIERKTIETLKLAPISRYQLFLGRVFGPKFVEFMKNYISGPTVSPVSNVNRSMSNSLAFQPDYTKSTVIFKTTKIQPIIQQQYSPLLRNA